jgi:uncharacterized RDD family membrane protein YckC
MITVLSKENATMGPFTREQVDAKLQTGEITLDNLAFIEGLSQWTPLRDVLAKLDVAAAPAATPAYSYAATMQPPSHLVYAGFWLRFAAYFIDYLIVNVPLTIISGIAGFIFGYNWALAHHGQKMGFVNEDGSPNVAFIIFELTIMVVTMTITWLYFAFQESSAAQATLGKRVIGIKVTNLEGQPIGFAQASGRFFGKIVSGFTLFIGFIMAGVTERKQALHDMLASTLVVKK